MIAALLFLMLALAALAGWLAVWLARSRPWDATPVGDDGPLPDPGLASGAAWPAVAAVVPARNEEGALPGSLPALLVQDYPGPFAVYLVDDRSSDRTAAVAEELARGMGRAQRLRVVRGAPLPDGWVGKVWAMDQGARAALDAGDGHPPRFLLLTDADILHAPDSVRRLVSESLAGQVALNSRMARLNCTSPAERLLIPAFVFFFNLLYPMRRVNDPADSMAGAAGGCVLLSRDALQRIGGFASIRNELIDDVNLARQVKRAGLAVNLALSRSDVRSLRAYPRLADIWRMVARSAFTELRYSYLRLAGALLGLGLLFAVPPAAFLLGVAAGGHLIYLGAPWALCGTWLAGSAAGLSALVVMRRVYGPLVRFFALGGHYAWSLPLAGGLYALMTLDSALRHAWGRRVVWRG